MNVLGTGVCSVVGILSVLLAVKGDGCELVGFGEEF